jgi:hypothetical protein
MEIVINHEKMEKTREVGVGKGDVLSRYVSRI